LVVSRPGSGVFAIHQMMLRSIASQQTSARADSTGAAEPIDLADPVIAA
jgi:hypothetical protein